MWLPVRNHSSDEWITDKGDRIKGADLFKSPKGIKGTDLFRDKGDGIKGTDLFKSPRPTPPAIGDTQPCNFLNLTYVIHLNKAGLLSVDAANGQWNERIGAAWGKQPLYFKAGAYVQDNSGNSKEGARVTFAKLDIDHD